MATRRWPRVEGDERAQRRERADPLEHPPATFLRRQRDQGAGALGRALGRDCAGEMSKEPGAGCAARVQPRPSNSSCPRRRCRSHPAARHLVDRVRPRPLRSGESRGRGRGTSDRSAGIQARAPIGSLWDLRTGHIAQPADLPCSPWDMTPPAMTKAATSPSPRRVDEAGCARLLGAPTPSVPPPVVARACTCLVQA